MLDQKVAATRYLFELFELFGFDLGDERVGCLHLVCLHEVSEHPVPGGVVEVAPDQSEVRTGVT